MSLDEDEDESWGKKIYGSIVAVLFFLALVFHFGFGMGLAALGCFVTAVVMVVISVLLGADWSGDSPL